MIVKNVLNVMHRASFTVLTACAVLTGTGGENKRDDFGVHLHRIKTAEGVHCAFVGTGSDRYGTIPATPESEKDELAFSRRPEVLMATPEIGFRRPPFSPTFTNNTDVMSSMIRCRINLPNQCYHLISRVARRVFEFEGLQAASRKGRYDKEKLLWQSTVAIKSNPVGFAHGAYIVCKLTFFLFANVSVPVDFGGESMR